MNSVFLQEWVLPLIRQTIAIQIYVISTLAIFTLGLSLWRRYRDRHIAAMCAEYNDIIVNCLVDQLSPEEMAKKIGTPLSHQFLRKCALRKALLSYIQSISGQEKNHLTLCYCWLKLANSDMELCYSGLWWRRLKGVSNLGILEIKMAAPIFWELRKDGNALVANAAVIALSAIPHELNNKDLILELRERAFKTQNFLVQFASNWGRVYGAGVLFDLLKQEKREAVIRAFVAAIAEMNSPEAGSSLIEWMKISKMEHEPETLIHILRTLKTSGDPASLPIAKNYFSHKEAEVRAEALDMWMRIAGFDETELSPLLQDSSAAVQRVWLRQRVERKAA